jgi:hypothetical protein
MSRTHTTLTTDGLAPLHTYRGFLMYTLLVIGACTALTALTAAAAPALTLQHFFIPLTILTLGSALIAGFLRALITA